MRGALNYLGQLRLYSFVDLLLLLAAVGADGTEVVGVSLLWIGFLVHLEWRHRDDGRLRWHWAAWLVPWLLAPLFLMSPWLVLYYALAVAYTYKKRFPAAGAVSPLLNGGLKATYVLLLPTGTPVVTALVFVVMAVRNLLGDVRDAAKDARQGVGTLPVLLGYRRRTPLVYPAGLVATSVLWTLWGNLPLWALAGALVVQASTYRLTPR
ncbi:hypothetical protein ABTZ99_19715 [Actinosynnema sp. NPDC002837]